MRAGPLLFVLLASLAASMYFYSRSLEQEVLGGALRGTVKGPQDDSSRPLAARQQLHPDRQNDKAGKPAGKADKPAGKAGKPAGKAGKPAGRRNDIKTEMDGKDTEALEAAGIRHASEDGDGAGPEGWDEDRLGAGETDKDLNQVVLQAEADPSLMGEGEDTAVEPLAPGERRPLASPPGGEVLAPIGTGKLAIAVISGGSGNANEISKRDRQAG